MNVTFFNHAQDVILEVELPSAKIPSFNQRYSQMTGDTLQIGPHFQRQENKRSWECRIYFNAEPDLNDEFANIDIAVEQRPRPYHETRAYRVNNVEFFWALVDAGYRVGPN